MINAVIRGIPQRIVQQIYDDLYNLRINCTVESDSPRHDTFAITVKRKHKTQVSLLVAKYIY